MRRLLPWSVALTLVLLTAGAASAGPIFWMYDWNGAPSAVTAGTGGVELIKDPPHIAVNSSNTVAADLRVYSTADYRTPDRFGPLDGHYTLRVDLTDVATLATGSLTFGGQFQGTISHSNSNLTNAYTTPTTRTLTLGDTVFVVSLLPFAPPGPPDEGNLGSISAHVEVFSSHQSLPEPAALTLAGLGAGFAGLAAWRRRRKAQATLAA